MTDEYNYICATVGILENLTFSFAYFPITIGH